MNVLRIEDLIKELEGKLDHYGNLPIAWQKPSAEGIYLEGDEVCELYRVRLTYNEEGVFSQVGELVEGPYILLGGEQY